MQPAIIPIAPRLSLKKILVATDLSYSSKPLVPIAAAIARRFHSELTVTHVIGDVGLLPESPAFSPELSEETAKKKMAELLRSPGTADVNIHGRIRKGNAATQITDLARSESFDLVITGTHGRRGFRHFLVGSVCEEIFRHVRCPVLTVGPHVVTIDKTNELECILFPTDLSPESMAALPYACAIASEFHAKLLLLHVLPPETAANPDTRTLSEPLLARMKELVNAQVQPSSTPEFVVDSGSEAETIQAAAKERNAGLIVLGLRHRLAGTNLHSTIAYKIVAEAHCPVLTIRSSK